MRTRRDLFRGGGEVRLDGIAQLRDFLVALREKGLVHAKNLGTPSLARQGQQRIHGQVGGDAGMQFAQQ